MIQLTNRQARQFMLLKQGLLGEYRFEGKQGAFDFVRQAGCIQFDPVDACGKNAELTLQSRVKGFTKKMLYELLYEDRLLVDYPDKNLSILPAADWPCFERYRRAAEECGRQFPELAQLEALAKEYIEKNGPVSSDDLPIEREIHWHSAIHWSGSWNGNTKAARAVLEQLYSTGGLVIHHKNGTRKYYDFAHRHLPQELLCASDPFPDEFEHKKWRVLRRIGAVGLLWNRPSDAWLNIWGLTTPERTRAFQELEAENKILPVEVEGLRHKLYCRVEDLPLLKEVGQGGTYRPRLEFIAPLDCFLWDRKLVKELFGFEYSWEIYTPAAKRKYGFYVLPVLYGERFAGRIEAVCEAASRTLVVKNFWYEEGIKPTKKKRSTLERRLKGFAKFNACSEIRRL